MHFWPKKKNNKKKNQHIATGLTTSHSVDIWQERLSCKYILVSTEKCEFKDAWTPSPSFSLSPHHFQGAAEHDMKGRSTFLWYPCARKHYEPQHMFWMYWVLSAHLWCTYGVKSKHLIFPLSLLLLGLTWPLLQLKACLSANALLPLPPVKSPLEIRKPIGPSILFMSA